ncbi:MAG: hypothetical protein N2257_09500 [Thermodesulfovibrionales bacterium]|nr:hypothetical protein [Thermodesulfovibrionales bacterium]
MPVFEIKEKIKKIFPPEQAEVLVDLVEIVNEPVKTRDFNELKTIVADLAHAQKELAEAQKRTELRLEELAEAQKRTEEEVRMLAIALNNTRGDLGGLQKTMAYAFENEAFRVLPGILKSKFQIELTERFIREEIKGREINIFGKGKKNGKEVLIVGESKLRLEDRKDIEDIFNELEEKVKAVRDEYGDKEIIKLIITHYATKGAIKKAQEKGIIVIQSFEW